MTLQWWKTLFVWTVFMFIMFLIAAVVAVL